MYSRDHLNEAFRLISEGFCVKCGHSNPFAVKRKTLDWAGGYCLVKVFVVPEEVNFNDFFVASIVP
jgi:hypothetical protein